MTRIISNFLPDGCSQPQARRILAAQVKLQETETIYIAQHQCSWAAVRYWMFFLLLIALCPFLALGFVAGIELVVQFVLYIFLEPYPPGLSPTVAIIKLAAQFDFTLLQGWPWRVLLAAALGFSLWLSLKYAQRLWFIVTDRRVLLVRKFFRQNMELTGKITLIMHKSAVANPRPDAWLLNFLFNLKIDNLNIVFGIEQQELPQLIPFFRPGGLLLERLTWVDDTYGSSRSDILGTIQVQAPQQPVVTPAEKPAVEAEAKPVDQQPTDAPPQSPAPRPTIGRTDPGAFDLPPDL